jgi:hypothetical protein
MTTELTPVEFEQQNYRAKVAAGECIVWYANQYPIEWVKDCGHEYQLHHDDGGDYSRVANVGKYEVCLRVEDISDPLTVYQRCQSVMAELLAECHPEDLVRLRIELQEMLMFRRFRNFRRKVDET